MNCNPEALMWIFGFGMFIGAFATTMYCIHDTRRRLKDELKKYEKK